MVSSFSRIENGITENLNPNVAFVLDPLPCDNTIPTQLLKLIH